MPTAVQHRVEREDDVEQDDLDDHAAERRRVPRRPRRGGLGSPSSDSWISVVAFQSRNRPPPIRIRSRHENSRPASVIERLRSGRRSTRSSAAAGSASPSRGPGRCSRARSRCSAGRRWTRIEMKMTLSMPSTISRTVRVSSAIHVSGVGEQRDEVHDGSSVPAGRREAPAAYHGPTVTDARLTTRAPARPRGRRRRRRPRPARAADARRRPPRRVPPRIARPAALPRLDARLPDEPQRLRGDGRPPARRGLRRGAVDGGRRPRRDQHLRDPRGRRAEGHRPPGRAGAAEGRATPACASS